jgi:hypothetical protein
MACSPNISPKVISGNTCEFQASDQFIKHISFQKKNNLVTCILAKFYSKCVEEQRI